MSQRTTLLLSKYIYPADCVRQAADAFKEITQIHITEDNNVFYCFFDDCKYDVEQTTKEFENYLIDLSNTHHL